MLARPVSVFVQARQVWPRLRVTLTLDGVAPVSKQELSLLCFEPPLVFPSSWAPSKWISIKAEESPSSTSHVTYLGQIILWTFFLVRGSCRSSPAFSREPSAPNIAICVHWLRSLDLDNNLSRRLSGQCKTTTMRNSPIAS